MSAVDGCCSCYQQDICLLHACVYFHIMPAYCSQAEAASVGVQVSYAVKAVALEGAKGGSRGKGTRKRKAEASSGEDGTPCSSLHI